MNDNELILDETNTGWEITLTDEECIKAIQDLLRERVQLGIAYISDPDTGILTHQFMTVQCGELRASSHPEELIYPLLPVVTPETEKRTLN